MSDRDTGDEAILHRLGYARVLYREMGGFSNFAISFTIISIHRVVRPRRPDRRHGRNRLHWQLEAEAP